MSEKYDEVKEVRIENWKKIIRHIHAVLLLFAELDTGEKIAWREQPKKK